MARPRADPAQPVAPVAAEPGDPRRRPDANPGHPDAAAGRKAAEPDGERGGDVRLLDGPFSEEEAGRALRSSGGGQIGAVVTFTGVVRSDEDRGAPVTQLGFDTFPEMALHEMRRIRHEALERYGLVGLSIWHRTDTMTLGEPIVLVAAAARHRQDAFTAAAWTMDEVKRRVPLWKHETRADGTTGWVHADSCTCGADQGRA